MPARSVLLAGLVALAAAGVPAAGQPKKAPAPKFNAQKVAAALQSLTAAGCQFGLEKDKKSEWHGHVRMVTFPDKATDATFARAIPHLQALPALTGVDIGGTKITDAGTAHLAKLPKLEALFLDHLVITGETLRALAGLSDLQWLVIHPHGNTAWDDLKVEPKFRGMSMTAADLVHLGACRRLRHLEVALPAGDLTPLAALTELEELEVGFAAGTRDADLAPFSGMTKLRRLKIDRGRQLTGEAFAHFAPGANLESVTVSPSVAVGDIGAKHLARYSKLTAIDLSVKTNDGMPGHRTSVLVTDAGLKSLAALENLAGLNLYAHNVTGEGLGDKSLPNLKFINLGYNPVTPAGLAAVATAAPNLDHLNLDGARFVTGDGFAGKSLGKLSYVGLEDTQVTRTGLAALVAVAPNLTTLNLDHTRLTDADIRPLTELRRLRNVYAVGSRVTPAGKALVEQAVPGSVVILVRPTFVGGGGGGRGVRTTNLPGGRAGSPGGP